MTWGLTYFDQYIYRPFHEVMVLIPKCNVILFSLYSAENAYVYTPRHLLSTVKSVLSGPSKRTPKNDFQDRLSLYAGHKYCRKLQGEHSTILSTFIKLPFSVKTIVLSMF